MIKYFRELFSSKEQQYVKAAQDELQTYKSDRIRLMRSLAMVKAAVTANEAAIEALESCLPGMRAQMTPKATVTASGVLAQVMAQNNAKAETVVGPVHYVPEPEHGSTRSSYK